MNKKTNSKLSIQPYTTYDGINVSNNSPDIDFLVVCNCNCEINSDITVKAIQFYSD